MGGGTDVEPYVSLKGGACISMAVNLRQRFTLYTGDDIWTISGNKIGYNCSLDFVYAFRESFGINSMHHSRFETEYDDVLESGLGSSAAAGVAMVGAMARNAGLNLTRQEIAERAWQIETKDLGLFGGKQDQYTSAYGGLNLLEFTNEVRVHNLERKYADNITPYIVLLHTNTSRKSAKIQEGLKTLTKEQIKTLDNLKDLVPPTISAIGEGDIKALGALLDLSWDIKKQSNKGVSNSTLDNIYAKAKKLGALGGKACGAGGGGFMFFMVPPEKRENFVNKMGLEWFDVSPDYNGVEVRVL